MKRFCGHNIQVPCIGLSDTHPGKKNFSLICSHKTTGKSCYQDVDHTCDLPCEWNCAHYECNKSCLEMCTRPNCEERCQLKLKCGHQCYSLCGEPCLSVCPECQLKKFKKQLKFTNSFNKENLYYQLPCMHIFSVQYLDEYVHEFCSSKSSDVLIQPLQCPVKECSSPFSCSYRYGNDMKRLLTYIQNVNSCLKLNPFSSDNISVRHDDLDFASTSLLQRKVLKITESSEYTELQSLGYIDRTMKQNWQAIKKDKVMVCYKPMPEISATLYKLKTFVPQRKEEKYLFLVFTEAINLLEILLPPYNIISQDESDHILKEIKRFLRFISKTLISDHQFKLNYQIMIDLKSEFFRLYLRVYTFLAESVDDDSLSDTEIHEIDEVASYLEKISASDLHVTKHDFELHMDAICDLIESDVFPNYKQIMRHMDAFWPDIYRGEWWRCSQGHYYCSPPSILEGIVLKCPECEGVWKHMYHLALIQIILCRT